MIPLNNGPHRWSEKYLEIPFVDPGWDFDGCHCWGLVWLVFFRELGLELNKHGEFKATQLKAIHRQIAESKNLDPWIPVVGEMKPFDVVPMRIYDYDGERKKLSQLVAHVGVASGSKHILHIEEGIHSQNMAIDNPWISRRIAGIFRHKALA